MPLPFEDEWDRILAPLPGEAPAGDPVPYAVREKLDDARKEVNPDDFPPDYPGRPELKRADWAGITRQCVELLETASKDLMIGARLTEALVKTHGFAGAWSGFRVLRRLVEEAWDRIHPAVEDGDLEVRAAPFNWLDDPARGARFPSVLRNIPLAHGAGDKPSFCCLDWEKSKTSGGPPMELIDQGVQMTPREAPGDLRRPGRRRGRIGRADRRARGPHERLRPRHVGGPQGAGTVPPAGPADSRTQGAGPRRRGAARP